MYLLESMTDRQGVDHKMVGAIPGSSLMTGRLSRFGYEKLTAVYDNLLCLAGETVTAHEFHYSDSDNNGGGFTAAKKSKTWPCIHTENNLFAGYPHLHFGGNVKLAASFLAKCRKFKQQQHTC
jgi:cobyrinic acid a,c-diamide synthase